MKIEQAKQIASKAIDELSQALERGHSEKVEKLPRSNGEIQAVLLAQCRNDCLSQRPDATRVAGFHTWKQLGRSVKKGAKGIMILAPMRLRKNKGELPEDEQSRTALGFRVVYVFDQADTEGRPICELDSAQGDPAEYTQKLKQFVAQRGIQLEYSDAIYPAQGQCSLFKIILLPGQAAAEEFCTLAHEAGHSLLHMQDRRAETTKRVRETEAEAVAFVVCEAIGLNAQNSIDYIHLYNGNKDTLTESLEHVQRASAEILRAIMSAS